MLSVVGIAGKAGAGKDTVADFIVAARGGYRYAFAEPIKQMLRILGIDMDSEYWKQHKEEPIAAYGSKSPRQLMQWLGTEWGRNMVDKDLWVTMAQAKLLELGSGMVISDVRMENEAMWVRRMGGLMIHVRRENVRQVNAHSTEDGIAVDSGDLVLNNNGTLEDLQQEVLRVFQTGNAIRELSTPAPS